MSPILKLIAFLTLLALLSAACGNDDEGALPAPTEESTDDGAAEDSPPPDEDAPEPDDGAEAEPVDQETSDDDMSADEPSGEDEAPTEEEAPAESDEPSEEDEAPASAVLGEPSPATGEAIKVGFISDGKSDAIDNSSETPAAEAAASYANDYIGGAGGRVIELVTCDTEQTPAGAQDCVAELASAGVVAILNGVSGQTETINAGANEAGIPFMQNGGISQEAFGSPLTHVMTNGLATLVGPAAVASELGLSKAGIIVIDVPAASGPISGAAPLFYGNAGIAVEIVAIAPGTPDMTPQVQAAISNGVEQFAIIGDEPFCTSAISAIQLLGFEGPVVVIGPCVGETSIAEVEMEGILLIGLTSDDPADAEVALFLAVMDEYAPGALTDSIARSGYSAVLGFARALAGHPEGGVTTESVQETILAMEPAPMPLGPDGATFQCNRQAIALAPAICSAASVITALNSEGQNTGYRELDLSDLLSLG
ncbi:MAG: ABC transporter substrate-binding protein [Acidimicrobiia bacterium]|nr:ABC transporter substrate-binding protein [Acidimicrobiia bacterium]